MPSRWQALIHEYSDLAIRRQLEDRENFKDFASLAIPDTEVGRRLRHRATPRLYDKGLSIGRFGALSAKAALGRGAVIQATCECSPCQTAQWTGNQRLRSSRR